jgi:hypothetical protein
VGQQEELTSLPIKDLFYRLKTCFVIVMDLKPPYMQPHMVNKAYTAIQETGLFVTICLDWYAMTSDRWIDLKDHFTEAYDYETYLVTSAGSLAQHGYASNVLTLRLPMPGEPVDTDSLNTICDGCVSHTTTFNTQAHTRETRSAALGPP